MKKKLLFLTVGLFVGKASAQVLDVNFGTNGFASTNIGYNTTPNNDLQFQSDGKIIVANGFLMRYNTDGSLDNGFGISGFFQTQVGDSEFYPSDVAIQPDAKIVVGGAFSDSNGNISYKVFRVDTSGQIDTQFGSNGSVTFADGLTFLAALAIQSDGKIVVGGSTSQVQTGNGDIVLQRFNANGGVDQTYGNNGTITMNFGEIALPGNPSNEAIAAMAILPNNFLIVSGSTNVNNPPFKRDFFVYKFDSTGTPDASFGNQGKTIVNFIGTDNQTFSNDYATAMAIDVQGRIIVAGESDNVDADYSLLLALDADGTVDADFGDNGKVIQTIDYEGYPLVNVRALKTDGTGRTLACGKIVETPSATFQTYRLATAAFRADGTVDASFGDNGLLVTDPGTLGSWGEAIGFDANQNLIVGGYTSSMAVTFNWILAHYNTDNLRATAFQKNTFSAYPNPFTDVIRVDFTLSQDEFLSVSLSDISGKKYNLISGEKMLKGNHSLPLDLPTGLSNGFYFLQIGNSQGSTVLKLIK